MMQRSPFLGAVLLIAGTAIGAGMLALPVSTASAGFTPSLAVFGVTWLLMMCSALLLLEVNLCMDKGANLITMAEKTVGASGKWLAWGSYLLLLYALNAAYLSGMGDMLQGVAGGLLHQPLPGWSPAVLFMLLFAVVVYMGTATIDRVNRYLISGLVLAFFALVLLLAPHVQPGRLLEQKHWSGMVMTLPIVVTSFGFHIVIPSLRDYLQGDKKRLVRAIVLGSTIPLACYILWEGIILGVVPLQGEHGLQAILATGQGTEALAASLKEQLQQPLIQTIFRLFSFFAITTSFIGVSLSLFDFLIDGFHLKTGRVGRLIAAVATFIPPLLFTLYFPQGFIMALGYAGIFVSLLLIVLPALMAWHSRRLGLAPVVTGAYRAPGGLLTPWLVGLFGVAVIVSELYRLVV